MAETEKVEKEKKEKRNKRPADKKAKEANPVTKYFRETRGEMRKITWPTREESWRLTLIVMAVSTAFAIFLWVFDAIFSNSLQFVLERVIGV